MIKKYRSDFACYGKIMPLNKILLLKKLYLFLTNCFIDIFHEEVLTYRINTHGLYF